MSSIKKLTQSFNGGEVTPEFYGQITDVKYQTGLALCQNYTILPHGPMTNRGGSAFVKEVKDSTKETFLIDFSYSTTQTMAIETGEEYFRFHTAGGTLLAGSPAAYNGGTAYVIGDLVSSAGTNYYCIKATTGNAPPNATYWYPLPSTAYEIPTPYQEADIQDIHYVQSADVLTLVHPEYAPRELRRQGATEWVLSTVTFASELDAPENIAATATVAVGADTTYTYVVTGVAANGIEESLPGTEDDCSNKLETAGNYNTITWDAVTDASRYNVYKQSNGLFGYIGQTDELTFIDDNITADIAITPPIDNDPFDGADDYPGAASYFEQRRSFAGTENEPQNVWMTKSGTESNLGYSIPTKDTDAVEIRVRAREANTIRHMVPLSDLILLTSAAEWRVTSVNSDAITPTSISVKPQSYIGASNVQPEIVNNNIIYAAARGGHPREFAYSADAKGYLSGDLALRAPHLFDGYTIEDMDYAKAPYPVVWFVSSSGKLLGFTYVPEQQVGAWHQHTTATLFGTSTYEACCVVAEGEEDALYTIVRRKIDGSYVRYIERIGDRRFDTISDAFFVDCGASYDDPQTITGISAADPGVVTTDGAHGFSNDDEIDLSDILGTTELNGVRILAANKTADTFELTDEDGNNIDTSAYTAYDSGGYARKAIITVSSGLDHLEGETVNILANGAVHPQETVTGGSITLDQSASRIHIGLPIVGRGKSLPLAFEVEALGQGREKNVNEAWLRLYKSSGLSVGPDFDNLIEIKHRTTEVFGEPPELLSEEVSVDLTPSWADDGVVCWEQTDPLPSTITSMTIEASIGD